MCSQEFEKKYPFIKPMSSAAIPRNCSSGSPKEIAAATRSPTSSRPAPSTWRLCCTAPKCFMKYSRRSCAPTMMRPGPKAKTASLRRSSREIYISLGYNYESDCPRRCAEEHERSISIPNGKEKCPLPEPRPARNGSARSSKLFGMEFLEKLAAQEINVQNISGAASSELVASGEVPLSPTIFNSNIIDRTNKKARRWNGNPFDPVIGTTSACPGWSLRRRIPMPRCYFSITLFQRRTAGRHQRRAQLAAKRYRVDAEHEIQKTLPRKQVHSRRMMRKEWTSGRDSSASCSSASAELPHARAAKELPGLGHCPVLVGNVVGEYARKPRRNRQNRRSKSASASRR